MTVTCERPLLATSMLGVAWGYLCLQSCNHLAVKKNQHGQKETYNE